MQIKLNQKLYDAPNLTFIVQNSHYNNMVFPQVIAAFHALYDVIGLPGNLLVIVTIILESRFHVMRYILLASLALSDFLLLVLVNSFRIKSIAQEHWLYGQTMCYLNPFFVRYFYINTVLHLVAVSYDRYLAIVKSPLTYDGTITKTRVAFLSLIWIIPIPLSIGPFLGWGEYVYRQERFFCEQGWALRSSSARRNMIIYPITTLVIPLLIIVFLNVSVYMAARRQINVTEVQMGGPIDAENPQQLREIVSRRIRDRKAAIDVAIIIVAFLVCFLPGWIMGICRQFFPEINVPDEVVLATTCIFFFSSLCNPIIYSIRKKEFRAAIRKMLSRIGVCRFPVGNDNGKVVRFYAKRESKGLSATTVKLPARNLHGECIYLETKGRSLPKFERSSLSPIEEISDY